MVAAITHLRKTHITAKVQGAHLFDIQTIQFLHFSFEFVNFENINSNVKEICYKISVPVE